MLTNQGRANCQPLYCCALFFYSYLAKNYKELEKEFFSKKVWDFSEAINVVIQGQPEWIKVFKVEPAFYPEHEKLFLVLNDKWNRGGDIDILIKYFLL